MDNFKVLIFTAHTYCAKRSHNVDSSMSFFCLLVYALLIFFTFIGLHFTLDLKQVFYFKTLPLDRKPYLGCFQFFLMPIFSSSKFSSIGDPLQINLKWVIAFVHCEISGHFCNFVIIDWAGLGLMVITLKGIVKFNGVLWCWSPFFMNLIPGSRHR